MSCHSGISPSSAWRFGTNSGARKRGLRAARMSSKCGGTMRLPPSGSAMPEAELPNFGQLRCPGLLVGAALLMLGVSAAAAEERHGLSAFGDLKYPANFTH